MSASVTKERASWAEAQKRSEDILRLQAVTIEQLYKEREQLKSQPTAQSSAAQPETAAPTAAAPAAAPSEADPWAVALEPAAAAAPVETGASASAAPAVDSTQLTEALVCIRLPLVSKMHF
jgi:hypothetical protein